MFDLKRKITIILITFKRSCFSIFFLFQYYTLLFYDRYTIFGQFVVCFDFNWICSVQFCLSLLLSSLICVVSWQFGTNNHLVRKNARFLVLCYIYWRYKGAQDYAVSLDSSSRSSAVSMAPFACDCGWAWAWAWDWASRRAQFFLCMNQWSRWHSRSQYCTALHLEHFLSGFSAPQVLQ